MMPTLGLFGDWVLIRKWFNYDELKRDDVVVALSPIEPTSYVCERIVGLVSRLFLTVAW